MAAFVFLPIVFGVLFAANKFLLGGKLSLSLIGRTSLAMMLIVTGIAHFTRMDLMVEMMPEFIPLKKEIVYLTGILELLAVAGLLINNLSKITSILLIVFFVAVLPANILGSIKQVNLGGMENGVMYLFFRIPLQFLFIFWAYYFGIKINR